MADPEPGMACVGRLDAWPVGNVWTLGLPEVMRVGRWIVHDRVRPMDCTKRLTTSTFAVLKVSAKPIT